jgi:hypothetical protein
MATSGNEPVKWPAASSPTDPLNIHKKTTIICYVTDSWAHNFCRRGGGDASDDGGSRSHCRGSWHKRRQIYLAPSSALIEGFRLPTVTTALQTSTERSENKRQDWKGVGTIYLYRPFWIPRAYPFQFRIFCLLVCLLKT